MKAEIKTTTEMKTMTVEIPVDTERVHMDVSIQEAHYILNLLGSARPSLEEPHGLKPGTGLAMFMNLHKTLGNLPQSLYPRINISLQERL